MTCKEEGRERLDLGKSNIVDSCLSAGILLSAVGGSYAVGLYVGTAIIGFFVSWQFGACFSWVAAKMNVTGRVSCVFFIGCGAGSLVMPPLVGYTFTSSLGTMSIMYLALAFCVVQCLLFLTMFLLARIKLTEETAQTMNVIKHE